MKRNIIIILSVVMLLVIGSAVVLAGGVLTDDQQDWVDARTERVEELVNEGIITQEQADEYLEQLKQCVQEGTCQGFGAGCTDGEDCRFGVGKEGECLGLGEGYSNGFCRNYSNENNSNNFGNGCSSIGAGRGCGR